MANSNYFSYGTVECDIPRKTAFTNTVWVNFHFVLTCRFYLVSSSSKVKPIIFQLPILNFHFRTGCITNRGNDKFGLGVLVNRTFLAIVDHFKGIFIIITFLIRSRFGLQIELEVEVDKVDF